MVEMEWSVASAQNILKKLAMNQKGMHEESWHDR